MEQLGERIMLKKQAIMIFGPDGTGKSTIVSALSDHYRSLNRQVRSVWLRFNHYFAKIVNAIGRASGRSYYETYPWGKVGYHNYHGVIGYIYIYAVYADHLIFRIFLRRKLLKTEQNETLIVDRYILDIMADLIVDTGKRKLVLRLFTPFVRKELEQSRMFVLKCDPDIVVSRRPDIADDHSYMAKVDAYAFLAKKLNIPEIDTGRKSVEEAIRIITS